MMAIAFCLKAQGFSAALSLGMNASQIDGDLFSGYNKPGILAGIQIDYKIKPRKWVGIELNYSELGSQRKLVSGSSNPAEQGKIQLNYISLPLYFKFQPDSRLNWLSSIHFKFGVENEYLIGSKIQDRDDEEILEYFKKWNFAILGGIFYAFNEKLGIEFRINESLNLIFNNDKVDEINANSLRNRSISIVFKYNL